jgi:hypothetical protein
MLVNIHDYLEHDNRKRLVLECGQNEVIHGVLYYEPDFSPGRLCVVVPVYFVARGSCRMFWWAFCIQKGT